MSPYPSVTFNIKFTFPIQTNCSIQAHMTQYVLNACEKTTLRVQMAELDTNILFDLHHITKREQTMVSIRLSGYST